MVVHSGPWVLYVRIIRLKARGLAMPLLLVDALCYQCVLATSSNVLVASNVQIQMWILLGTQDANDSAGRPCLHMWQLNSLHRWQPQLWSQVHVVSLVTGLPRSMNAIRLTIDKTDVVCVPWIF